MKRHVVSLMVLVLLAGCATTPSSGLPQRAVLSPALSPLEKALREYRALAARGGWPVVPAGSDLRQGETGDRVLALRERLRVTSDLTGGEKTDLFDSPLEEAVRHFQRRHGLDETGIVGPEILAALNVPVEERIRKIEFNLQEGRETPDLGKTRLEVNIPDFSLQVMENGRPVLSMKVIVGRKKDWQTPLLTSAVTHLILNPKWNVPPDIFEKEIIHELRKDPEYLGRERLTVVQNNGGKEGPVDPAGIDWAKVDPKNPGVRLVQVEGPGNSLGRIKFMFPNRYDIYLHDTPAKSLFKRRMRALSHGCVRVEKPLEMAEFLMKENPQWTGDRITAAIRTAKNQWIALPKPVPIGILYRTAWVDDDGTVQFREDIYGKE